MIGGTVFDLTTAMSELEALGTEQAKKLKKIYGAQEPLFGVTLRAMKPLMKKKTTRWLWRFYATCNYDAQTLAGIHLGYSFVREELRVIPAKVYSVQYFQEKLVCPTCHEEDETTIIAAKTPTPLFPHSPASPDMTAMVMYNKGALYLPFYRQERDWQLKEVRLSRETQARWFIQGALQYLDPIYKRLHEELLHREVIHADEVPCQVFHEKNKPAASKSYMWIYLTGTDGKASITLYDYQPGRSGIFQSNVFRDFVGSFIAMDTLHTAGLKMLS